MLVGTTTFWKQSSPKTLMTWQRSPSRLAGGSACCLVLPEASATRAPRG